MKRLQQQLTRKSSRGDTIDIDGDDSDDEMENGVNGINRRKKAKNTFLTPFGFPCKSN